MSIFDKDKPITKKFLKSKGFKRYYKAWRSNNGYTGIEFFPCHYPVKLRNGDRQPNTAIIRHYDMWKKSKYEYFNDIYTEQDIEILINELERKYKMLYL